MDYTPEMADKLYTDFALASKEYQDYVNIKEEMRERAKDLLAAITFALKKENDKASMSELEMRARASEEYQQFKQQLYGTLKEEGRRWIKYEGLKKKIEIWQTAMATLREQVKKFAG